MPEDDESGEKLDLGALKDSIAALPKSVQDAVLQGVRTASEEANASRAAAAQANDDNDDGDNFSDVNLESLSRNELVGHLDKRVEKAITKALKPLISHIKTSSNNLESDQIKRDFQNAANTYPDFMEWKEEMGGIISKHPELSAEDVYTLARSKNPEKVKEIDDKAAKLTNEKKDEETGKVRKAFGGLTPTSGQFGTKETNKAPQDASNAAWDEVMGSVPAELIGGNI